MFRLKKNSKMRPCVLAVLMSILISTSGHGSNLRSFVVGIDKYPNLHDYQQLTRSVNDAKAVSKALNRLGFQGNPELNLTRSDFITKWQNFLDKIQEDDTIALFFSGHGMEIEGQNYLLPSSIPSTKIGRQTQIERESLSVAELLQDLQGRDPKVTLLILDACRDNPLISERYKSVGNSNPGLAKMEASEGTFIMYSAAANETALDRLSGDDKNKNSVYTRKLLPLLKETGLTVPNLARQLRSEVSALAKTVNHAQSPAYYDGLIGDFCIAGCDTAGMSSTNLKSDDGQSSQVEKKVDGLSTITVEKPEFPDKILKNDSTIPETSVIPAAVFLMGDIARDESFFSYLFHGQIGRDEKPVHEVKIDNSFAMGRYEITFAEYAVFANDVGKTLPENEYQQNEPITNVTWQDAVDYAEWLSEQTGKHYYLPSEAEWEYAARGGSSTRYWWGDAFEQDRSHCDGCNSSMLGSQPVPVNSFGANGFGLYNVTGNVSEWVRDCYEGSYSDAPTDGSPREVENCEFRVLRGGSFNTKPRDIRLANRAYAVPGKRQINVGFRIARAMKQ